MEKAPVPISQSHYDQLIIAHAVTASVATLITIPTAILVGRYLRTWRYWNHLHAALNAFSVALIIATFILANVAIGKPQYVGSHSDLHHKLGLAVFIIVLVQSVGGLGAKLFTSIPKFNYVTIQSKRPTLRYIHIFLGIATAALLYAQFYTGFGEWDQHSDSQTQTPRGINIAFWILLAIEVAAYAIGWIVMEPLARKKRAREAEVDEKLLKV